MVWSRKHESVFGQHFLTDVGLVEKIVRRSGVKSGDEVLEIGPGLGILTRVLLAAGAKVTCVELDRDLAAYLEEMVPQVRLIQGDAMRQDWDEVLQHKPVKVVANLPYNVGTHVVMQLIRRPDLFSSVNVMLQKEVVDRMMAEPGSKAYGASLSKCNVARKLHFYWRFHLGRSTRHRKSSPASYGWSLAKHQMLEGQVWSIWIAWLRPLFPSVAKRSRMRWVRY